jgi:hypothetical protein
MVDVDDLIETGFEKDRSASSRVATPAASIPAPPLIRGGVMLEI